MLLVGEIVDGCERVSYPYQFHDEVLHMAVSIAERYISTSVSQHDFDRVLPHLMLIRTAAIFISVKYCERVDGDFLHHHDDALMQHFAIVLCDADPDEPEDLAHEMRNITLMEMLVLFALSWKLDPIESPMAFRCLQRFHDALPCLDERSRRLSEYLLELSLHRGEFNEYESPVLAAAVLFYACKRLRARFEWTDSKEKATGLAYEQIQDAVAAIHVLHRAVYRAEYHTRLLEHPEYDDDEPQDEIKSTVSRWYWRLPLISPLPLD